MGKGELSYVPVAKIDDTGDNMRAVIDDDSFNELVASIGRDGIISPILLRASGDRYEVIAGHRRFAAAQRLRLEGVPAFVVACDDAERTSLCFAENLFRKDLSAIEQAAAVCDTLERGEYNEVELGAALGRSVQWIRHQTIIASWPTELQQVVHVGRISVSAASNLAQIDDDVHRASLIDYAIENGASARTTAAWLQAYNAGKSYMDPGEVPIEESRQGLPPIEPHTPCAVCKGMQKMAALSYLPVCSGCGDIVLEVSRNLANAPGTAAAGGE